MAAIRQASSRASVPVREFLASFRGRRVLILGLGRFPDGSGAAATRFFLDAGARVTVTDAKSRHDLAPAIARLRGTGRVRFVLGRHRMRDVEEAELVVRNPGVPSDSPYLARARDRGIPIISDVALFFRVSPAPIIGVTGTRGKSTTSALLASMLRADGRRTHLGGNIKVSPLTFLDNVRRTDAVVLELSSWMLETLDEEHRSPEVAAVTNVLRDHLNTYPSMAAYARAKASIIRHQGSDGVAVLSADNPLTKRMAREVHGRIVWTSVGRRAAGDAVFARGGDIVHREDGRARTVASLSDIRLPGAHNIANALVATALALRVGVAPSAIRRALRAFRGLPDRDERIAVIRGVRFVNDTTATTPDAVIAALRVPRGQGRTVLIAGGMDKRLLFGELAREIARAAGALVLLPGSATTKLVSALGRVRGAPRAHHAATMREAVRIAFSLAKRGDTVLLSPGAASFNLFENEFHRGDAFRKEVKRIGG